MCNCSPDPVNICTQCQSGNPCGCPPDYSIMPQPVPCGCCPSGFTYVTTAPNGVFQSGNFINYAGQSVPAPVTVTAALSNVCADTVSLNAGTVYYKVQIPGGSASQDAFPTALPVQCISCAETISADCVILPAIPCYGLVAGMTLTQLIEFMCGNPAFIEKILSNIGLTSSLGSSFCQLVQNCPPISSGTTPIIGSITITYP